MVFQLKHNYSWSFGNYKVSADVVGKTIEKLEAETGAVTNKGLLDVSRDEASPTHSLFEWDDTVAGEKYRLYQAKQVINHLKIEVVEEEVEGPANVTLKQIPVDDGEPEEPVFKQPQTVRAFVSINHTPGTCKPTDFVSINTALSDEDYRKAVLRDALAQFKALESKYSFLTELAKIFEAIDSYDTEDNDADRDY